MAAKAWRESGSAPPETHHDQDAGQGQQLAQLHADVEREHVGHQTITRQREILQLGRQTETVEETEDQHGGLGVGLEAEPTLERTEVVQRLVNHRQADDGIDEIGVDVEPPSTPSNKGDAGPTANRVT